MIAFESIGMSPSKKVLTHFRYPIPSGLRWSLAIVMSLDRQLVISP
ncbi:MAG: hypothetical protein JXA75_03155 [Candidatus Thermoplasmatota archaeon]|nr:hypothetical protein [Candidatus Thermoplasmatota archaeon]